MTAEVPCFGAPQRGCAAPATATRKPPDTLLRGRTDDLFREYFPRLVRLLSPVLRDRPLAEDLAQETMSRFLVRLDRLDTSTPVWPWLKTVAMRLAIDHLRRGAREVPYQPQEVVVDENAGAREDTYWCEEGPELVAALRDLPKRQRQALALRYLHDRDPADVARALNLSKGALDQLVFRARRNMSRRYAPISRDA